MVDLMYVKTTDDFHSSSQCIISYSSLPLIISIQCMAAGNQYNDDMQARNS